MEQADGRSEWILGIDASGKAASCALLQDGLLVGESYLSNGYTHSETLLPLVLSLLEHCRVTLEAVSGLAVTVGPGSFTGLRIGLATVKGLAFGRDLPCCGISTLDAMAVLCPLPNGEGEEIILCPAMDARRGQVYNALFARRLGTLQPLTDARALSVEELVDELVGLGRPVWLTGDGAALCAASFNKAGLRFSIAPEYAVKQRALGAALFWRQEIAVSADKLTLCYLRLPQAERERQERLSVTEMRK